MKRRGVFGAIVLVGVLVTLAGGSARAYTEEEKALAKSMLEAYGYSPDMAGASQAYQDYLSGMYNDICEQYGLPKQNVGAEDPGDGSGGDSSGVKSQGTNGTDGTDNTYGQTDDGRIHFGQPRMEEGNYQLTLEEIWVDDGLYAPAFAEKDSIYEAKEGYAYADLVFRVENMREEDLDVSDFLQLSLNDHSQDYEEGVLLRESENGISLGEDTTLKAQESGLFHYGIQVPEESRSFVGTVTVNGNVYEVRFDTSTHPRNRETLEKDIPAEIETQMLTLKEVIWNEESWENEIKVMLHVENADDSAEDGGKKSSKEESAGLMVIQNENLYRGSGQGRLSEDGIDLEVTLSLPKECVKEELEILVYYEAAWYSVGL